LKKAMPNSKVAMPIQKQCQFKSRQDLLTSERCSISVVQTYCCTQSLKLHAVCMSMLSLKQLKYDPG
jgi:hypothetical protein